MYRKSRVTKLEPDQARVAPCLHLIVWSLWGGFTSPDIGLQPDQLAGPERRRKRPSALNSAGVVFGDPRTAFNSSMLTTVHLIGIAAESSGNSMKMSSGSQ